MFKTPKTWDSSKINLKYVVSYEQVSKRFFVDTVPVWKYHSDCHVPKGFRMISAGYFSVPKTDYQNNDMTHAETWGGSEGFQIGPKERDLNMLKGLTLDCTNTYDDTGNATT